MLYSDFKDVTKELISNYIKEMKNKISNGLGVDSGQILYPNILLFTKTEKHYIFELIGSNVEYNELKIKHHSMKSTQEYLYQFEEEKIKMKGKPLVFLNAENNGFKHIKFSRKGDQEALEKRFKFTNRLGTNLVMDVEGEGPLVEFGTEFKSCYIEDCLFVNKLDEVYRVKDILCMGIISKSHLKKSYIKELLEKLNLNPKTTGDLFGVHYCDKKDTYKMVLAGQFSNMFLVPGIRETTIGEFINSNPSFIKESLPCVDFLYEENFPWLEGNDDSDEKFINPDLLIKRSNGFYDICDLKTPKLSIHNLTKGGHKRRRFFDYVEEGIAQLANYEDYFSYKKNKEYALKEVGVIVNDPILYLIVGNYENLKQEDVREASRRLKDKYRVIDFDTLHALYLNTIKTKIH